MTRGTVREFFRQEDTFTVEYDDFFVCVRVNNRINGAEKNITRLKIEKEKKKTLVYNGYEFIGLKGSYEQENPRGGMV